MLHGRLLYCVAIFSPPGGPRYTRTEHSPMNSKTYPERRTNEDFVYFLHIPKTAGTSVANTLVSLFPEDQVLTHDQINSVRKHPREIFLNASFYHGHFTHEVYGRRLPKQPSYILTFLRDPIEHFVSTFFHLKIDPTFTYTIRLYPDKAFAVKVHDFVKDCSIEEFLESEYSALYDNFQTRYLVRGLSSDYLDLEDELLLPIAQRFLLQLPFFGLTERFDDSMIMLGHCLDLPQAPKPQKANRSRNKPRSFSLSADTRQEIERRTASDQQLYRLAQQAFEARLQALPQAPG